MAAWICPVCEGVNSGGRLCATCGERLPDGFVPRSPTRQAAPPATPTVVRAPRPPRDPSPEEIFGSNPFR
ncbi:hypothetical protein [Amnibacterium setariae]|uniref:RanBP2-type domain-containing protein n=1 Tax=Amnibacterium setariae TaxID=2306585 RepID=A0A3A1TY12_9MICO|nr:hypothetical protein [Amnibacterium setariae]RIX27565.1 hypothetical protein D1781_08280 [Amnibacterium setariae]